MEQTVTQFAEAAGISTPYASEIISGKRKPSLPLALWIYKRTGRAFGAIAGMGDDAIASMTHLAAPPKPRGKPAPGQIQGKTPEAEAA